MKISSAYINTQVEKKLIDPHVFSTCHDGVTAISVNYIGNEPLDKFRGVEILLTPGEISGFTAICRHSEYWCKPVFCKSAAEIPENTQCLIWDGGCLLPVCDSDYLCMVSGTEDSHIKLTLNTFCSDLTECNTLACVYGAGHDSCKLIKKCAETALGIMKSDIPLREQRKYPELFEYLGWCSWDAFMTDVSEDKLLKKCEEFKEKDIPVKWVIIDDMWADCPGLEKSVGKERGEMIEIMYSTSLNSFKADSKRFPNGLEYCISKLHGYGLKVGMWHPTAGYWKGILPNGEIASAMPDILCQTKKYYSKYTRYSYSDILLHAPDYESARAFYGAFHEYLKSCGADFVKVDYQSFTHMYYHDMLPIGRTAKNLHRAIDESVNERFGGTIINCMGTSSENMWSRPSSTVSRCSDDFLPENREWFTKHILQCSFNSMLQGVFHVCDWDMWWTDDSQAVKNSVLRAISGGPIYISDTLDRSKKEILMPLCFSDGKLLRCREPAVPVEKCVHSDPETSGKPFVIKNRAKDTYYLAAFDLDSENRPVCDTLSASDISDGIKGDYILYEYFTKTATAFSNKGFITLSLTDRDDFRLYSLTPKKEITFIGLENKMIATRSFEEISESSVKLYEGGVFVFVTDADIADVQSNGKSVPFEKVGSRCTATVAAGVLTVIKK